MALAPEEQQSMIDKLLDLFQNNEAAIEYGNDPNAWVEENLPEGAEAADVAACMPQVAEQMGGPYQANAARYNATHGAQAQAATASVVNEISYTYNTVYQQNAFTYVAGDAQVTNINGDGNIVNQTDIDAEFDAEHPPEYDDYEEVEEYEEGGEEEPPYEEGGDEEPPYEETGEEPPYEDGGGDGGEGNGSDVLPD